MSICPIARTRPPKRYGRRCRLDWRPQDPGVVVDSSTDAMYVVRVAAGSPGARAGLQPGDRIRRWNGRAVEDVDWMFIDANIEIDRPIPLEVDRRGARLTAMLVLG